MTELLDLRSCIGNQGRSKGNLIKWEISLNGTTHYIKTGRTQTRDFPTNFGIEPVIEFICYEFAKILNIPCASQTLHVSKINHDTEDVLTLINVSKDFKQGNEFFEFGDRESILGYNTKRDFSSILTHLGNANQLITMVLFDLIILNEDRHDFNFGYLLTDTGVEFAPIYDNGYALLYDDIKGMLKDYTKSLQYCNCNSFYLSFHNASKIIQDYKKYNRLEELCNIEVTDLEVRSMMESAYNRYNILVSNHNVNNIPLSREWFEKVTNFLIGRLNYVRSL